MQKQDFHIPSKLEATYSISHKLAKWIRRVFLLFAAVFVCRSFYRTMEKANEDNVLVKEEVHAPLKYRYPSMTFCYKFKHGHKDIVRNYYPELYEKWKNSSNNFFIVIVLVMIFYNILIEK